MSSAVRAEKPPSSTVPPPPPLSAAAKIIHASNPTTPLELIEAIDQLVTFGEMELAKQYAQQLGQQDDPNSNIDLIAIGDRLGPVPLLRIANNTELDSAAQTFCKKILAAVRQRDTEPGRLNTLANIAVGNDPQSRRDALAKMRVAGPAAVAPLVMILMNGSPVEQAAARRALVYLGDQTVPLLLAVLETENEELRKNVLSVLSSIAHPAAADDIRITMLVPQNIVKVKKTSRQVQKSIRNYLLGRTVIPSFAGDQNTLWEWNDKQSTLSHREASQSLLAAQAAYRLARALSRASFEDQHVLLEAAALLQFEKLNGGLDQPLNDNVRLQFNELIDKQKQNIDAPDFIEAVFELAIEQGYVPVAIGAAEVLAQKSLTQEEGASLIARRGAAPHPLITAASHQDRRLRMAACNAILALSETHPFVGTSIVSDALSYFAASQGKRRVLIADNRASRRRAMASMLKEVGYLPDVYTTGRMAIAAAQRQPDYIAAFISFTIGPRTVQDILHELRTDSKTAGLPIALLVDPRNEVQAESLVADDPLAAIFFTPENAPMAGQDMEKLIRLAGDRFVTEKERLQQAKVAIKIFGKLMQQAGDSYNPATWEPILAQSIEVEQLAPNAADVLSQLKTPAAQRTLVEAASNPHLPMTTRQITAKAFAQSIAKHGIGLSTAQIQRQKARYESTEGGNPEEEAIHWSILESLNKAAKKNRD